ncbi:MAG: hypothetical protein QMD82_02080, partial [bacterium]|nr:hypothetical protein [bacterium]
PTFKIFKEVENRIKEHEGKTFNLGDILEFLKEPPYGIYPNMVHYSLLGFVLRPYVNKLYESGTGRKITPILMKEKIKEVFNYLTTNRGKEKLEVRYGRQDEIELTEILKEIFRLEQVENLNQAKWGIREWIRKVNLPIWSLEGLLSGNVQLLNAIRGIDYLNKRVDKEITEELIKKILPYFKNFKTDLMLLLEREKVREGFKNWLLSEKNTVKINESEVDEVIEYLHKNMQEEVALWEKEKVLLKLKDWESEKTRERYKVEFINKLSSLFDLQRVNSIQELKDSVKNYINTNLKYPLWSIKYVLRVEDIIDFLEEFVRSYKDPSQEEIEKFLELLPSFENLLHKNLNSETAERGIQEWLKSRNSMCSINDINNFLDFIRGDIQKEPCFWEEKDLIKSLKKYNFLKQVAEIFNLEENYLKSTDDLRIKVKNRVAEMPYPFWAVGLVSDEEIKEAVHKLSEFIVSGKDDPVYFLQDLENLYQLIERNKDRIKSIWESSQVEKFYKYWVKKILNVNEDVSRILNAIKAKLKNEDYYWRKIEVENLILREKEIFLSILGKEMKEQVVQKVKTTNKDLRDILLKLVETYPQIISKLDELL